MNLASFAQWEVHTTDLTELDIALVAEGAAVNVQLDALPGSELDGVVTAVGLVPNVASGDVVYTVEIALRETADLPLRWGMTAFVDIET